MPIYDVRDSFVGGSGGVHGRVPEVGRAGYTWALINGASGTTDWQEMNGHIESSGSNGNALATVGNPRNANYRVYGNVATHTVGGNFSGVSVCGRVVDHLNLYQFSVYTFSTWRLVRSVAGDVTVIANGAIGAGDFGGVIELEMVGSSIRAYINGSQVANVVDGSLTAKGRAGVQAHSTGTTSLSRVFDFSVKELINPIVVCG